MTCDYCRPHADVRRQRLCHVGAELFAKLRDAGEQYINIAGQLDPAPGSMALAKETRQKAREAFDAHITRK